MIFACAVLVIVHHDTEGPMQTVLNLPVPADQYKSGLGRVLLGKQTQPLQQSG